MKILYIHNSEYSSEQANSVQVKSMANAMAELDNDVVLSVPNFSKQSLNEVKNENDSFRLHFRESLFSKKKYDKYLSWFSVKKSIQSNKPDLIYLRHPLMLRQALSSDIPIIIELHNNRFNHRFNLFDNYLKKIILKAVYDDKIIKVVCISEALSKFWINYGIPKNKIITAHDGIDHRMFKTELSQKEARIKTSLPLEKKIVIYAGRLYKNRKIDHIVKLAEAYPSLLFLIIGGPEEQRIKFKNLADKKLLKNIIFKGQIPHDKIPEYLYASDVLLALWSSEVRTINYCSPLKIFEYMASGKIIIAHGFPTIKEVIEHNKNGLLIEPDSYSDLSNKLNIALKMNYPSEIAKNAKSEVFEKYTWQKRATRILSSK